MARNTIYYAFALPPLTGGDFVAIDHIAGLRMMGFDAKAFYGAADDGHLAFGVPVARLGTAFRPDDIVVVGENQSPEALRAIPCVKVMHNQNPYLTFYGFPSVAALNGFGLAHILVPSDFCAARLGEMGVAVPISRVRPGLPDYFSPAPKRLQIAYSPAKRDTEANFLQGYFRAVAPAYADVPWVALSGLSRPDCARILAGSAVYAALPRLEGLGLMSLEAMACACLVVGYTGHGGVEYATPGNGTWIGEGDHAAFAAGLAQACGLHESDGAAPRRAAARATAAAFSAEVFTTELAAAWDAIMGDKAGLYRL